MLSAVGIGGVSDVFDSVFGAVALAFDHGGFASMQEPIEDGGGEGRVVVEDFRPFFVGAVGAEGDGAAFVAGGDDLEQQVGAEFVDGQVSDLVNLC